MTNIRQEQEDYSQPDIAGEIPHVVAVGIVLFLLECVILRMYRNDTTWITSSLVVHLLIVAALFAWSWYNHTRLQQDIRLILFLAIMVAIAGPFGAFTAVAACGFYAAYRKWGAGTKDLLELLDPYSMETDSDEIYERIVSGQEMIPDSPHTEPYIDVMTYGSVDEKQMAIVKMTKNFHPEFSRALQMALKDQENTVRVQAAAAMATLRNDFSHTYHRGLHVAERSSESRLEFARFCARNLDLHILDDDQVTMVSDKCIAMYRKCIDEQPHRIELKVELADVLLQCERAEEAYQIISGALGEWSSPSANFLAVTMRVLYSTCRFEELQQYAAKWEPDVFRLSGDLELQEMLETWQKNPKTVVEDLNTLGKFPMQPLNQQRRDET